MVGKVRKSDRCCSHTSVSSYFHETFSLRRPIPIATNEFPVTRWELHGKATEATMLPATLSTETLIGLSFFPRSLSLSRSRRPQAFQSAKDRKKFPSAIAQVGIIRPRASVVTYTLYNAYYTISKANCAHGRNRVTLAARGVRAAASPRAAAVRAGGGKETAFECIDNKIYSARFRDRSTAREEEPDPVDELDGR